MPRPRYLHYTIKMSSQAIQTFNHSIQDATELLDHFDALNTNPPPPPNAEVLKRASLVMALAALETYIEDRISEAASAVAGGTANGGRLAKFYLSSLENDLKYFHTPSTDRVRTIFEKYLAIDVTEVLSGLRHGRGAWENDVPEAVAHQIIEGRLMGYDTE